MIDTFNGDPVPEKVLTEPSVSHDCLWQFFRVLSPIAQGGFDFKSWIEKHDERTTRPLVDAVIAELKNRGINEFGATGYCFGGKSRHAIIFSSSEDLTGKYVFNLAQDNVIKVGAVSHPSLLQMPGDLEKLLAQSKAPILINSCDIDQQFPAESCGIADKLFGEGKYVPGYKRVHWEGCTHGFAVSHPNPDPS